MKKQDKSDMATTQTMPAPSLRPPSPTGTTPTADTSCPKASSSTTAATATTNTNTLSTTRPSNTPATTTTTTTSVALKSPVMGMKHSKSDHSGLGRKEKKKEGKTTGTATTSTSSSNATMDGKKFISKSQENLSSQKKGGGKQQRELTTVAESPQPRTNAASVARSEKNKENLALKEREKNSGFVAPKPVKTGSMNNLRKASSAQSIDKTSDGSASLKSNSSKSSSKSSIKRAQSTQNICKDKLIKKRTSAPADVMAYNAELLANFEKEKKILESRISELTKMAENRKGEIEKYKYEVRRLKDQASTAGREEADALRSQNRQLSDRLKELGHPAEQIGADSEKLMLKWGSSKSQGSCSDICLPTSASCDSLSTDGGGAKAPSLSLFAATGGDPSTKSAAGVGGGSQLARSNSPSEAGMSLADLCGTPDHPSVLSSLDGMHWEKQSNKSANSDGGLSEASVACLTERILQMEETNYSTTEELQATLQELGDLQDTVNELTEENGRFADQKAVLLESLCTQTEKLENTRIQLEQLKCLLISGELPDKSERDGHLLGLLKSAQEEREELMRKQMEWANAVDGLERECGEAQEAGENLRDKYSLLTDTNTAMKAEMDVLEKDLAELKEAKEAENIEVARLRTLLDNEKAKVCELEKARKAQDKTDLEALLDSARTEKDKAEQKVADLTDSLSRSQCEVSRLKDTMSSKEQELIVARNNAHSQVTELQYLLQKVEKEKADALDTADTLQGHLVELEANCDRYVAEQKTLNAKLRETHSELGTTRQKKLLLEGELQELLSKHDTESEEWRQFQKDLQTAVVIANNFSQETQENMEQLTTENAQLNEKVSNLESELAKLKSDQSSVNKTAEDTPSRKPSILTNAELKGKVLNSMDRDLTSLREGRQHLDQRSQNISVKSLIRSIEEKGKSGCSSMQSSQSESRRSSTSSDISLSSLKELVKSPTSPLPTPESPCSPNMELSLRASAFRVKPADRSPQPRLCTPTSSSIAVVSTSAPNQTDTMANNNKPFVSGWGEGGNSESVGSPTIGGKVTHPISSILKDRSTPRRNSAALEPDAIKKDTPSKDPLASLAKLMKGSKRNALLKWCQMKTIPYSNVDITNFSSSWNDGLGFCALLHSYLPDKIPYTELTTEDKRKNFNLAFSACESVGIKCNLNINDMVCMERPDWQAVMAYVTSIYKHFEVDKQ